MSQVNSNRPPHNAPAVAVPAHQPCYLSAAAAGLFRYGHDRIVNGAPAWYRTVVGNRASLMQVLVVEDGDDLRDALCDMFAFEGYRPIACSTGEAAWTQLACGLRPSVLVTDLALPGLSGRELVDRVRARSWGHRLPILILSAWENVRDLGMPVDAILVKGGEPETIARTVDRLARWDAHRRAGGRSTRKPAVRARLLPGQSVGSDPFAPSYRARVRGHKG